MEIFDDVNFSRSRPYRPLRWSYIAPR